MLAIRAGLKHGGLGWFLPPPPPPPPRDPALVEGYGLRLFERYAGGELGEEIREMVAAQAQKRVGLRFVASRVITWDHRKLDGGY
jgi:hypothetical protein